ncbi:class I SAM-dependent methyltransferase [Vineibacter terrae]|uniref:Class I SAM-dependent methyltransferase n=1 Tax=Vineibacter terrae TaxID=2586908 RepID=A0A5C8PVC8_9HYPH|nr:class I SAM-dependent methyltransferase [Vineibacter terrae]TXL82177.1 class I SAM-dependent methyltransferase [Vineibacter terrae]
MPKDSPLFLTNTAKTCLKHTYLQNDPRATMRTLGGLDYVLANVAAPIFRQLIAAHASYAGRALQVLDLGCAYGTGTALLRFPVTFATLQARYTAREMQALDAVELEELDRLYYAAWPRDGHRYVGVDAREAAVSYAHRVGTVDSGIAADLERAEADDALAAEILRTDIVVATGRIGVRTAMRIAHAARRDDPPWIATFMNRTSPGDELAAALAPLGLVTERFDGGSFAQRRFESAAERDRALSVLQSRGIDPAGKEADGWLHADLYVARPAAIAESIPLHRMVSIAGGACGPRPWRLPRRA